MNTIINKKIAYIFIVTVLIISFGSVASIAYARITDEQLSSYIKSRVPAFDPSGIDSANLEGIAREELKKEGFNDQEITAIFITGNAVPLRPIESNSDDSPGFVALEKDFFEKLGGQESVNNTSVFFNNLFTFGIYIAGFLATIMIAVGGIQYMSTDAVSGKTEGRERITYAIMGLLLVLFSWILLNQINPDLLNLTI